MKRTINCPCCSSLMLHHICDRQEYWFCRQCWQKMPILSGKIELREVISNGIKISRQPA